MFFITVMCMVGKESSYPKTELQAPDSVIQDMIFNRFYYCDN